APRHVHSVRRTRRSVLVLFLMRRRPPTPTLFPYTTLFRSRTNMEIYWDRAFVAATAPASPVTVTTLRPAAADLHYRGFSRMYRKDRKSTRLNSSHVSISYAVFCLKKKKNKLVFWSCATIILSSIILFCGFCVFRPPIGPSKSWWRRHVGW